MRGSYNCQVKYWIDSEGVVHPYELMAFDALVYGARKGGGNINICSIDVPPPPPEGDVRRGRDFGLEARRRALRKCRDLATCNPDLKIFATFTLDGAKIDRYDYKAIVTRLNNWLDNRVRRNGLKYVIVPEHHKDGAVHFHGLMNDVLERRSSGVKHNGKLVYNLPDWALGFTTAQLVAGKDCTRKVSEYVLKYITKSPDKVGGRYYLHGGSFDEPRKAWYNIDISRVGKTYEIAPDLRVACTRDELTISKLLTELHMEEEPFEGGLCFPRGVENTIL